MRLFDGTPVRTAVEAEAHLKKLIDADPGNYFLWSRLGNLFNIAEEDERAIAAFTKAVELNPLDVESHHSLADYHMARGETELAAKHCHEVLRHCRHAPPRTEEKPALLRSIVRHTLECLYDLCEESRGRIPFMPPPDMKPAREAAEGKGAEEAVLVVRNFDLSTDEGWEGMVEMFLGPPPPEVTARFQKPHRPLVSPPERFANVAAGEQRVGRNDPCPCGSGKKFKKCCGR
jgi:hypothetical protein